MRGLTLAAQFVVLTALCLAAAPATAPATAPTARSAAESAVAEFLGVLRDPTSTAEQRATKIKEASARHLDFDTLARLSLGPTFRSLTPAQQAEFTTELRRHMLFIASRSVSKYDQEAVTITSDRLEANGDATIFIRVTRKPNPAEPKAALEEVAKVDLRLRLIDGQWKAIDIIIQNVSLAGTFRAQFTAILKDGGVERLIELLRDKNAASERAEKAGAASGGKK